MRILITTGNGYAPEPLEYAEPHQAWTYINDLFYAVCNAKNPEVMPIHIEFVKEKEAKEDDTLRA